MKIDKSIMTYGELRYNIETGDIMCNLYGYYRKNLSETIPKMIDNPGSLQARGRDSFGYVYAYRTHKLHKEVKKEVDLSFAFTKHTSPIDYFAFESRAIPEPELIEHLKAGLDHERDTQPFVNQRWVSSHNGTIICPEKVIEKWNLCPESPVDSAILPELFTKCYPFRALRYHLDGSYALAAYDRMKHELYLGCTFQPLYYVETQDFIYYASIKEQLEYLNLPVEKVAPYTGILFSATNKYIQSLYREDINKKVLVICSGGLDSVTTARLYQVLGYEVSLLHFLYAQAAESVEFQMIKRIAKEYNYPLIVIDAREIFKQTAKSSRLLKGEPASSALEDAEGTPSYVGNRNMIFASVAAGIAEENKIGRVVMGLNLSDSSAYPDNALPYLLNMEETLRTSLNQQSQVLFRSPFTNLMKHEILKIAVAIGSPLHLQVSCYYPTLNEKGLPKYCKGCGSQLLRAYAFKYLGLIDPCEYDFDWSNCLELPTDFWERVREVSLQLTQKDIPYWEIIKSTF